MSAREAHNYAEAVKHAYDTPVYSESSAAAGNFHLGQRYWHIWPIYCRLLVEVLYPYYLRKPIPEFYAMVHEKLLPNLRDIEAKLAEASAGQEAELQKAVAGIARKVMGR